MERTEWGCQTTTTDPCKQVATRLDVINHVVGNVRPQIGSIPKAINSVNEADSSKRCTRFCLRLQDFCHVFVGPFRAAASRVLASSTRPGSIDKTCNSSSKIIWNWDRFKRERVNNACRKDCWKNDYERDWHQHESENCKRFATLITWIQDRIGSQKPSQHCSDKEKPCSKNFRRIVRI